MVVGDWLAIGDWRLVKYWGIGNCELVDSELVDSELVDSELGDWELVDCGIGVGSGASEVRRLGPLGARE